MMAGVGPAEERRVDVHGRGVAQESMACQGQAAVCALNAAAKPPAWDGMFFVYNRVGKEAILAKAILRMRGAAKETPRLSQVTLAGVPVFWWGRNPKLAWAAVNAGMVVTDLYNETLRNYREGWSDKRIC